MLRGIKIEEEVANIKEKKEKNKNGRE